MNFNNQQKPAGVLSPAVLLALATVLTISIILGTILLMRGDLNESLPKSPEQNAIFRQDKGAGGASAYSLTPRTQNTSGGGSLDMFQKANEGYAADESSSTEQAVPEAPKSVPQAAPAKKPASKNPKKARPGTVIPRMQRVKAFGTAKPGKQGMPEGGAVTPDMSELMKQFKQKQGSGN